MVTTNNLLTYEASGCGRTALNEVILPPGDALPRPGTPQERLIYFLQGRGIASIYEATPDGDVYEVRQDLSVYLTPAIQIEIINTGDSPLRYAEFLGQGRHRARWRAILVGRASQRGATVDRQNRCPACR